MRNLALPHFIGAYLHQDWPDEYGDPWRALDDFIDSEPTQRATLVTEIHYLLTRIEDESELRRIVVEELGSAYLPEADGWTYRSWLHEVARRASQTLKDS